MNLYVEKEFFLHCAMLRVQENLGGLRKFQQNNHELGLGRLSIKPKSSQIRARLPFLESLLLVLEIAGGDPNSFLFYLCSKLTKFHKCLKFDQTYVNQNVWSEFSAYKRSSGI